MSELEPQPRVNEPHHDAEMATPRPTERPHPLTALARTWIMSAAAGYWLIKEWAQGTLHDIAQWPYALWIFGGVAVVQIVAGFFSWRFTRFIADAEEFRIERTFIWHSSDKISYPKIQSVDVQQPFAARLLGLAKLHVDVGGGSGKNIEYLSLKRAEELREHLLRRTLAPSGTDSASEDPRSPEPASGPEIEVVRATPLNLAIAALTSSSFLATLVLFIVIGLPELIMGSWGPGVALLLPLGGIIGAKVIGQWNYRLIRSGGNLRVSRGLTTLASQSVPRHRIQGIRISQPLLSRPFGLWQMRITVLGYGAAGADGQVSDLVMPAGTWRDAEAALNAIWPGFTLADLIWDAQPPPARWLTWFTFRTRGWALGRLVFASRRGLLTRKIDLVPYARIQGFELVEGPLQRLLGLAGVTVHISPGSVSAVAAHLLRNDARTLAEWLVKAALWARAEDLSLHALLAGAPVAHHEPASGAAPEAQEGPPPEAATKDRAATDQSPACSAPAGEEAPSPFSSQESVHREHQVP